MVITETHLVDGGKIPFGYGIAWRNWHTDTVTCLPLGINVVAAYIRRCYHWLLAKRDPSVLDVAFEQGRTFERERRRSDNAQWDAMIAEWKAAILLTEKS